MERAFDRNPSAGRRPRVRQARDASRRLGIRLLGGQLVLLALLVAASFAAQESGAAVSAGEWRFRVLLDGKEIGYHRYDVRSDGDHRIVNSRAEFDVRFLFFNAYRYRHSLSARWRDGCIERLDAKTDANGKTLVVHGERQQETFIVEAGGDQEALPPCVMNFAYWDPRILEQPRLLNPQTGEYLDIDVRYLGDQVVDLEGASLEADAYRIIARDMRIDLWYAKDDGRWLALESLAKGERIIRYERI